MRRFANVNSVGGDGRPSESAGTRPGNPATGQPIYPSPMTTTRRFLLAMLVVFAATAHADEFISLSDVHFNPYYDTSLMAQLEASDVSQWPAIFASSKITTPSTYGADTNYPLFQSFLPDLKVRAANARFVTITGDLLGHDFPQNFQLY